MNAESTEKDSWPNLGKIMFWALDDGDSAAELPEVRRELQKAFFLWADDPELDPGARTCLDIFHREALAEEPNRARIGVACGTILRFKLTEVRKHPYHLFP